MLSQSRLANVTATPDDDLGLVLFEHRFPAKTGWALLVVGLVMGLVAYYVVFESSHESLKAQLAVLFAPFAVAIPLIGGIHYLVVKANRAFVFCEFGAYRERSGSVELLIRYNDAASLTYTTAEQNDKTGSWVTFRLSLADFAGVLIELKSAWAITDADRGKKVEVAVKRIAEEMANNMLARLRQGQSVPLSNLTSLTSAGIACPAKTYTWADVCPPVIGHNCWSVSFDGNQRPIVVSFSAPNAYPLLYTVTSLATGRDH